MDAGRLSRVQSNRQRQKNFLHNKDVHQLSWVFSSYLGRFFQKRLPIFFSILLFFLLAICSIAQTPDIILATHVRGSVVTHDGQPIANATVEIRDLKGNELGKSSTDSGGAFEIATTASPGEYILLAGNRAQLEDQRITIARNDLAVRIAFSPADEVGGSKPLGGTVSVEQLRISAKARAHLGAAHKEFDRMDINTAMKEIDKALKIDPNCAPAMSMRAFLKLAARDAAGAVEDARRAILLDVGDAQSYVALGTAYNSLREFEKAEAAVRHALNLRPDFWQAQIELAKSFYGRGEFVLALRELDAIGKDFPDVHLVRGNVLLRLDRRQEAMDQFRTFLEEAPGDPRTKQIERLISAN